MVADRGTCFAQSDDLGVSGGIGVGDVAIEAPAHDLALVNHDGPDGNFSGLKRTLRGAQGLLHPEFVCLEFVHSKLVGAWIFSQSTNSSVSIPALAATRPAANRYLCTRRRRRKACPAFRSGWRRGSPRSKRRRYKGFPAARHSCSSAPLRKLPDAAFPCPQFLNP